MESDVLLARGYNTAAVPDITIIINAYQLLAITLTLEAVNPSNFIAPMSRSIDETTL